MDTFQRFESASIFENLTHRTRNLDPSSFPGRKTYIVSDLEIPESARKNIGPVIRSLDGLSSKEIAQGVFYIAFQCDSDALPILKEIKAHNGTFVPHLQFSKTDYRFVNRTAFNAIQKTWARSDRVSHLLANVHENICEALELTSGLEGDYVEIGVYLGGSALTALNFMHEFRALHPEAPQRKAWLLDTFDGFNYDEAKTSADTIWVDTHKLYGKAETIAYVNETLCDTGTDYELVAANICADELPTGIKRISVANIDVDMYEPTIAALNKVADLMPVGGIILAEDPTCTPGLYGALIALEEFLASEKGKSFYKLFKSGQYFLIKMGETPWK